MRMTKEQLLDAARKAAKYAPASTADILNELATRLDVTSVALSESLALRDAVMAENHLSRNAVQTFCDVVGGNTDAICEEVGEEGVRAILIAMKATGNMPATDAILDSLRTEAKASGLDEMATTYRGWANEDGCSCNMKSSYNLTAERAESYAAYIRRPAKTEEATSNG